MQDVNKGVKGCAEDSRPPAEKTITHTAFDSRLAAIFLPGQTV